jgi:ribonuclease HI
MFSIDLPNAKTNNEAEYGAVICALDILKTLFDFPRDGGYNVTIHTDSQLVVYHVSGDYKKCKPKFIPSRDVIRNTITAYANNGLTVWLKWVERDIIVEKVGH